MKKEVLQGIVRRNEALADNVFRMEIQWKLGREDVKAGQFVNVYPKSRETLLPRPISICRAEDGLLTLVYGVVGKGTAEFASYKPGETVTVSSPLGNGYDLSAFEESAAGAGKTALLAGGGIGVPPLLELAVRLRQKGANVQAVLGFRDQPFLIDELEQAGAHVFTATDSGAFGYRGTVLDLIRREHLSAEYCFACGPKGMLRALAAYGGENGWNVQVSLEERMGCGYGACVGCVCGIRQKDGIVRREKVCKDGPVFSGAEVVWDE